MKRLLRILIACALLPVLWGALGGLWTILADTGTHLSSGLAALALGSACMWIILAIMPRPHRLYVLGHELTHAFWALLTGNRVHKITVGRKQGSVTVNRSSTLLRLAPYLFPFYALLLIALFLILQLFTGAERYMWAWLFAFGAAWGFHAAFTVAALRREQTDINRSGWLLSMTLILLVNTVIVALTICAVTPATVPHFANSAWRATFALLARLFH